MLKKKKRPVPRLPIYFRPIFTALVAGILPFWILSDSLYYLFSSLWGHYVFTMWGVLFMTLIIVITLTGVLSIILTYLLLNALDHRWWWRSFISGGSVGVYTLLYSFYFYALSDMTGFLQGFYFFGYSLIVSFAIFLMMGSVSFLSALAFIKNIYERSKVE